MFQFISNGGPIGWLLLLLLLLLLGVLGVRILQLSKKEGLVESKINHPLYIGILSAVLGFTATLVGIYNAAFAIGNASAVSPQIIWQGIGVAVSTTIFGLVILTIGMIGWFVLKSLQR